MRALATVLLLAVLGVGCLGVPVAHAADASNDAYVSGYAAAVLEREFQARATSLRVDRGVITLQAADLGGADRGRVTEALSRIRGVVRVEIRDGAAPTSSTVGSAAADAGTKQAKVIEDLSIGFLPGGHLFKPLLADPRWPHFGATYQYYINDRQLSSVASVSFGETITLYRDRIGSGWWETGIQAGVFALFDLEAPSMDLINADYMGAVFAGYRYDKLSAIGRLFHQSSHLGDEFILRNRIKNRVNLSYEAVDLRVSYEFFGDVLRPYAGGGYLFDQEPSDLKPGFVQWGVEFRSPWRTPAFRPVAAVDVQNREENNWHTDFRAVAGIEFEGWLASRSLQIMLEYFRGHSPNGQFYREKIDYIGLGVHFNF
ncbi:MAG TPA: DUF1207 domain-containing protein [Methylomirabilota bacterium]|nr:DUF1207 domain-containing protein [Methylomirabilota bacterium]